MAYTDRFPIVNNFLETRLSADCDAGEATLYLENVEALPRILVGRDYIPLVLRDAGSVREIVYVDSVDTDSGAVVVRRGQEGTNAAAWVAGSYAYCTVTADSFQRMRVNGFAPLAAGDGRPSIARTSASTVNITGDFTAQLEVGMAVRILSGETVVEPTDAELGAIHITSVGFSAGMTSVSFQNVSLPTKVDGLDLGLSVASAPMYHPDTVVVDEDTLTQTQNVLRVSEKFKSEIEDKNLEQDAAIGVAQGSANAASQQVVDLDSSLRSLIAQEVAKCLKLSGGTMTGAIESNANNALSVVRGQGETIAARAENTNTGKAVRFGVGASGARGIYDESSASWLISYSASGDKLMSKGANVHTSSDGLLLNSSNVDIWWDTEVTLPAGGTWVVIGFCSNASGADSTICNRYAGGTKVSMTKYSSSMFILAIRIA